MPGYFKLLVIGASVAALSAVVTWLLIHASVPERLVAQPRKDRWHTAPVPTTGGIAILLSASVFVAALGASPYTQIVGAGLAIALLGLTDDLLQLKPAAKLFGQAVIAACVVGGGVVFPATHTVPLDSVLTWAWIVGMTNAFNLIDNMDGLCAGVTVIICSSRVWSALQSGDSQGATLGAILAG